MKVRHRAGRAGSRARLARNPFPRMEFVAFITTHTGKIRILNPVLPQCRKTYHGPSFPDYLKNRISADILPIGNITIREKPVQEKRICPEHGEVRHYLPPGNKPPVCIVCRRMARDAHAARLALQEPGTRRVARAAKRWRDAHPEKARRVREAYRATPRGFARWLWSKTKQKAARDRLAFDLDPGLLELALSLGVSAGRIALAHGRPDTATLVRRDPRRGWTTDNTVLEPAWYAAGVTRFGAEAFRDAVFAWSLDQPPV